MPRKSAASLSVIPQPASAFVVRPEPPVDLTPPAAEIWRRLVASRDPKYFDVSSQALLATLCKAQAEATRIEQIVAALDPVEELPTFVRLTRVVDMHRARVSQLSTRLRLTKQSQLDAKTAARDVGRQMKVGALPWEFDSGVIDKC